MATSKKPSKSGKKTTAKKSNRASARPDTGPLPPYGDPIRAAMARGNTQEMKNLAASTRKYLAEVESALAQLDNAIKGSGS